MTSSRDGARRLVEGHGSTQIFGWEGGGHQREVIRGRSSEGDHQREVIRGRSSEGGHQTAIRVEPMVPLASVPEGPLKDEFIAFDAAQVAITLALRAGTIERGVDFCLLF